MKVYKYKFQNNGTSEYNDAVFPAIFDLANNDYAFKIHPTKETKYWRVGIALSIKEEFEFNPNEGRYNNSELKYIELDVGELANGRWHLEDRIYIGSYYIKQFEGNPKGKKGYEPLSEVEFKIEKENSQNIRASYTSKNLIDYRSFELPQYRYFKLFAWADTVPFELEVEIKSQSSEEEAVTPSQFIMTEDFPAVIEVEELANEIAEILTLLNDEKGNMFGLFGRWGRGKTRLWEVVWTNLKDKVKNPLYFYRAEFHAWKYQDTPASWAYLYEVLSEQYSKSVEIDDYKRKIGTTEPKKNHNVLFRWIKNASQRTFAAIWEWKFTLFQTVKLNYFRNGLAPLIRFILFALILLLWIFIAFRDKLELLNYIYKALGLLTLLKILYLYFHLKPKASSLLKKYTTKVSFQTHLGLQAEIQKEIVYLLKAWIRNKDVKTKKIVLFVDDIDRCSEDKVIQIVDALKVMLENPEICKRLIVVAALDERVLRTAIRFKYRRLRAESQLGELQNINEAGSETDFEKNIAREYIDKLFIGGVRLGELDIPERIVILDSIVDGKIGPTNSVISNDYPGRNRESKPTQIDQSLISFRQFEQIDGVEDVEQEKNVQISLIEYQQIREVIAKYGNDSTPRSIRIYYYRYLLAKKIMHYKSANNRSAYSEWHSCQKKIILPVLIMHHSIGANSKSFYEEYKSLESARDNSSLTISIDHWDFTISPLLYKKILEIVEMVVPY